MNLPRKSAPFRSGRTPGRQTPFPATPRAVRKKAPRAK